MSTAIGKLPRVGAARKDEPHFVFHSSFEEPGAEQAYAGAPGEGDRSLGFMPDDTTRDCAKRMHYAAWRASLAPGRREAGRWWRQYYDCRDRIVVGNQKLTFRAVQKWAPPPQLAEDMTGECQIVLIKVVAAFDPWLGIRFSTYAFTCLMRALSRLSQRHATDRLARWLPLGSLSSDDPCCALAEEPVGSSMSGLEEYLQAEHPLLTAREKTVLMRRYHLNDDVRGTETLAQVGRELGLSKERVRQVQSAALEKLRAALLANMPGPC